jgi:hypothetical protein
MEQAWTETGDMNSAKYSRGGAGIPTSALAFGGVPTTADTEIFNGSTWSEINNLSTGRSSMGRGGSAISALCAGGHTTTAVATTEEFTADLTLADVTVS